jgi:SAM-dependent methyltransferase
VFGPDIVDIMSMDSSSEILESTEIPQAGPGVVHQLKSIAKTVYHWLPDQLELWTGVRTSLTPPLRLIDVGSTTYASYEQEGQEFLRHFIELADLAPHERILDMGCGIGRMAGPLTGYLKEGNYDGFDIVENAIRWCTQNITTRFPHFRFQYVNLHNSRYNPTGVLNPATFRFPYPDQAFDFTFATSLFTHLLPASFSNYLGELRRTLKPSGRALVTLFLLDDVAKEALAAGRTARPFPYDHGSYRVMNTVALEAAVAYDEGYVQEKARAAGLRIRTPIRRGHWCPRPGTFSYQDLIILERMA